MSILGFDALGKLALGQLPGSSTVTTLRAPNITPQKRPVTSNWVPLGSAMALIAVVTAAPIVPQVQPAAARPIISPPQLAVFNPNLFTNPLPFAKLDWNFAKGTPAWLPGSAYPNLVINGTTVAAPFAQYIWPPVSQPRAAAGRPYVANPDMYSSPFAQYVWATVVQPRSAASLPYIANLDMYSSPFAQYIWPAVARALPATGSNYLANPNLFTNPLPFSKTDWNVARNVPTWLPGTTYPDLVINTVVQPSPFAQYDWRPVKQPLPSVARVFHTNPGFFTNPIPFAKYDWSKPFMPVPSPAPRPLLNVNMFIPPLVLTPIFPLDWSFSRRLLPVRLLPIPVNPNLFPPAPPIPPIPPGGVAARVIGLDAAYGSADVLRFFRAALPSSVNVGDPVAILIGVGTDLNLTDSYIMVFTKPDGSRFEASSPQVYVGLIDASAQPGIFEARTYTITVLPGSFVDQHGYWSCFLQSPRFTSTSVSFYIGPPTVLT